MNRRSTIRRVKGWPRTIGVRSVSGHRLVSVIEFVTPRNADREESVRRFVEKAAALLESGIHVLVVELLPAAMQERIVMPLKRPVPCSFPADKPLTLASYAAGRPIEVYLEHLAVGATLAEMPLFLTPERYVNVPLEGTYGTAYAGMPAFWKDLLEGRGTPS